MQNILDLYKNPLNSGEITDADIIHEVHNPNCGDKIKIFIKTDKEKIIDVKHQSIGCSISMASASMLTEKIKNMTIDEVKSLNSKYIKELIGVQLSPIRLKCALTPLEAIHKGLLEKHG